MVFRNDDEETLGDEELNDEDATLADDLLDEVGTDEDEVGDEDMEGFGHLTEDAVAEAEEEKDGDDKTEDETTPLEEDAEEVDFDTFDDVDEM